MIAAAAAGFDRDLEECFAQIGALIASARRRGARLLVLPEAALGGYLLETDAGVDLPPALERGGPELRRLAAMAGDLVVCAGYTEDAGDGVLHASAVCVHDGAELGHHRKVHLPPVERFAYTAGSGFAAFDTPVGRLGMLVCYDKLFPEAARALTLDGAEIVCCLAAWVADRHAPARRLRDDKQTRHFDVVDQARAIENQVVWVSSNQAGPWGRLRYLGGANVVCPDGAVLAATAGRPGLALADVDPRAALPGARMHIDHLADRRPETYAPGRGAVVALNG